LAGHGKKLRTAFRVSVLRGVFPLQNRLCRGNVVEENRVYCGLAAAKFR
jgi:hypothetical protein